MSAFTQNRCFTLLLASLLALAFLPTYAWTGPAPAQGETVSSALPDPVDDPNPCDDLVDPFAETLPDPVDDPNPCDDLVDPFEDNDPFDDLVDPFEDNDLSDDLVDPFADDPGNQE